MKLSPEILQQDLRRALRGSMNPHNDQDIRDTARTCSYFGLPLHVRFNKEAPREPSKKGSLGIDMHGDAFAAEFMARRTRNYKPPAPSSLPSDTPQLAQTPVNHYTPELDPEFLKFVFCRAEVTLALAVVAIENKMPAEKLLDMIKDIRKQLKDPTRVTAMQDRYPDITNKRVKKVIKELKL